ncbi:MAG: cupin-like domain-containing protein [Crocosphaera sp.]|nr:cupin-like domain-containing protein [Crocosphaera sp.]
MSQVQQLFTLVEVKSQKTLKGFILTTVLGFRGLKTVLRGLIQAFNGQLADDVGDTLSKVPKSIRRKLLLILSLRGSLHNNQLFANKAQKLASEMLLYLETSKAEAKTLPVPKISFYDIRQETFFDQYIRNPQPLVIKDFPFTAYERWSLDWFIEHCGDSEVILTSMDADSNKNNYVGTLSELKNKEKLIYVHNSEHLLLQNPELFKDLNLNALESLTKWKFICAQIFLGSKMKTGATYHCARVTNFFYMIKGKKTWTFVDPRNSLLLYPYLTPGNAYQDSLVPGFNDNEDFENFPLYRYCPRLQVTLESGDILLNPSWWWHSVRNVTEETIGVSSRWSYVCETNNLFSALMEVTPGRHLDRRTVIEGLLSKDWDTRGRVKSSEYNQDNFVPSMFEINSHSEEVADAKKSGLAQKAWFK